MAVKYPSVLLAHAQRGDCVQQLAHDLSVQVATILSVQARASLLLPGGSSPQQLLPLLAAVPVQPESAVARARTVQVAIFFIFFAPESERVT